MTAIKFDEARYQIGLGYDFTVGTGLWLIVNKGAWTPAHGDEFIASILAAGAVDYGTRQPITNPTVTLDHPNSRALWACDSFNFPDVPNGQAFDTLVLANFVTNDSDSWLIAAWPQGALTGDGADIVVTCGNLLAW